MNCQTVRNLISAYIDCELTPDQKRELRNHLFRCVECSTEYHQLLAVKNCLENVCQAPEEFSPLEALYQRLEHEKVAFLPHPKLFWSTRVLMLAACLFAFFLSTFILFPVDRNTHKLTQEQYVLGSKNGIDQNISIDQSVTVYQASLVLP